MDGKYLDGKRRGPRSDASSRAWRSQIEFLNSVIIDLQRKNEDLKDKLEKMAAAALNGNSSNELDNHEE